MKKSIILILAVMLSVTSFSQVQLKQGDSVEIKISGEQYVALIQTIDANIDSKKAAKEIIDFLQKIARIAQPAKKPDEVKPKPKN